MLLNTESRRAEFGESLRPKIREADPSSKNRDFGRSCIQVLLSRCTKVFELGS